MGRIIFLYVVYFSLKGLGCILYAYIVAFVIYQGYICSMVYVRNMIK